MKKSLLVLAIVSFFGSSMSAQCTTANQSINATFGSLPACWTLVSYASIYASKLRVTSSYQSPDAIFVLPKTVNAQGILNFVASNTTNGQQGYGNFTIGAVSDPSNMASFEPIATINIYPTSSGGYIVSKAYTVDLSAYTGSHQYIAFKLPGNTSYNRTINFISFDYESGCISTVVDAIAQDYTVQLDNTGNASIDTSDINNGSNSDCDGLVLSLNQTTFDCSDIGNNTVILTATDNQGNTDTAHATVTVLAAINDETVTADDAEVCVGGFTDITTGSSIVGINYSLKDYGTGNVITGPLVGTGSSLSFSTGSIDSVSTFEIYAETKSPWTGLSFDGVDDLLTLDNNGRGITTQLTFSSWVKTSFSSAANFLAGKYNGASGFIVYINTNGKLLIDGRDDTGAYKSSGASTTVVNDGNWHYLSGTINISTGKWSIYVDGVLENSSTHAAGTTLANTAVLSVGNYLTNKFSGEVDEVSLWNVELGQASIDQYKSNCLTGTEIGLVGLYNFNEGSGLTVTDLSSYGLNGTLSGMDASNWVSNNFSCGTACNFTMTDVVTVSLLGANDITTSVNMETITANQAGATYQWLDCDNSNAVIASETNQDFTASSNGNYSCEVTVGCRVDTTACVSILTVGTDEINLNRIVLYPNPSHSVVNISGIDKSAMNLITVTDIKGKTVLTFKYQTQLNVEALEMGIYFVQIKTSTGVTRSSFVKK